MANTVIKACFFIKGLPLETAQFSFWLPPKRKAAE